MFNSYFLDVLKNKYVAFEGRARRSEYWYFMLFRGLISLALTFGLALISESIGAIASVIFSLATFLPTIAVTIRRMHDVGKSGWFMLIPIYNLILACTDSVPSENEYGPNPKGIGNTGGDDSLINSIGQ